MKESKTAMEPGTLLVTRTVQPREVDLFLFSAITWNPHRIHYDRDYARTEGYPDMLVAGPHQAALLAQMLSDYARSCGGRVESMSVRHRSPAYCSQVLELEAVVIRAEAETEGCRVEADLRIRAADSLVVTGRAGLMLPVA